MRPKLLFAVAVVACLGASPSKATTIYNVDIDGTWRDGRGETTVTGFIETDGTIGATHVLGWSLQGAGIAVGLNSTTNSCITQSVGSISCVRNRMEGELIATETGTLIGAATFFFEFTTQGPSETVAMVSSRYSLYLDTIYGLGDGNNRGNSPGGNGVFRFSGPIASVPGPIVGAGLPGLILASAGFLGWRRRRQNSA